LTGGDLAEVRQAVEQPLPAVLATYASAAEADRAAAELRPLAEVEVVGPAAAAPDLGLGPCTLVLDGYRPEKKIMVIKLIRELTGAGLAEAKGISEAPLPVVLRSGLAGWEAQVWLGRFLGHGEVRAIPE